MTIRYEQHRVLGTCFGDTISNYIYVPIPKNASTFCANTVGERLGWREPLNFRQSYRVKTKIPFIVIRDPIERWITGITEFIVRSNLENNWINLNVFKNIVFDEHTIPQIEYLRDLNLDKAIIFKFNLKLEYNFCKFINYYIKPCKYTNSFKFYSLNPLKEKVKKEVKQLLYSDPKYVNIIVDFYKQDIEFYNTAKIWNTPTNYL